MFEKLKNVPKWAWWVGGAIVAGGLGYMLLTRGSASAQNAGGGSSPTATTSTVTGGQGGVPASSGGGSGNTSVYSPTTTTTTTYADTYTMTNAPTTTTDITAGGNISLPGTAADTCASGGACGGQGVGTATLSASQVASELQNLGNEYRNTQSMAQRDALHAQAQALRQLAANEGLGSLVPTKYGYQGLQIGGTVY